MQTGYRALPKSIKCPCCDQYISSDEFESIDSKILMQEAPSCHEGHLSTEVWYAESRGYILKILFSDGAIKFILSMCTFTPTMGMDSIDGLFASDAEEFAIQDYLGVRSPRMDIFKNNIEIATDVYLSNYGVGVQLNDKSTPWWKFWK